MAQTFWEPEVAETKSAEESQAEPVALALSAADFTALEERIVRAVDLVKRERQARAAAEERAVKAETQLGEQSPVVDQLKLEIRNLRTERDQVRQRVERLLKQLDALELGQDPEQVHRSAALVDAKMRAVSAQGRTVDSLRVAVLAALNLADELLQSTGADAREGHARALTLRSILDEVLDGERKTG
jgi:cell division protein ZapA